MALLTERQRSPFMRYKHLAPMEQKLYFPKNILLLRNKKLYSLKHLAPPEQKPLSRQRGRATLVPRPPSTFLRSEKLPAQFQ